MMPQPSPIPYTKSAEAWFDSLARNREVMRKRDESITSRSSWMYLTIGESNYTIPIKHGSELATLYSIDYVLSLPSMWEALGVREMTVLQALEVKSRALVMGDIAASMRRVMESGLLPKTYEGTVRLRNPYNFMTISLIEELESIDKSIVMVSMHAPKRWRDSASEDAYGIRAFVHEEHGQGIGLGILNNKPDVSPFDMSESSVFREAC